MDALKEQRLRGGGCNARRRNARRRNLPCSCRSWSTRPCAETNRDVTQTSVAAYFEQKRMTRTITAAEAADALSLAMAFDRLAPIMGDDPPNTWTLFEEFGNIIPEVTP